MFLRGELPVVAVDEAELDRDHRHAVRHGRADVPAAAAHRLRQPLRAEPARPVAGCRSPGSAAAVFRHPRGAPTRTLAPGGRDRAGPDNETRVRWPAMVDLVIVGGGNMGAALLGGLLARPAEPPSTSPSSRRCRPAAEQLRRPVPRRRRSPTPSRRARRRSSPSSRPTSPAAVAAAVAAGATRILSIAAGVSIAAIEAAAGDGVAVVRAMPNTPALVGQGASAIAGGTSATDDDLAWAERILGAVGTVVRVDEQPPRRRHRAHRIRPGVPVPRRRGADRRRRGRRPAPAAGRAR